MAKSSFPCAECGAQVQLVERNRAQADRSAAWHASQGHVCDDCKAKHLAAENAAAAAANAAAGLPELTGSPKQAAWAETIRRETLAFAEKLDPILSLIQDADQARSRAAELRPQILVLLEAFGNLKPLAQDVADSMLREVGPHARFVTFQALLRNKTRASWWIDHREYTLTGIAKRMLEEIAAAEQAQHREEGEDHQLAAEAQAEALLKPAGAPASTQIAEIAHVGDQIHVAFADRREDFRLLMRGMGFLWAVTKWARRLSFTTGDPTDRMAETAHRILALGYLVRLHDDEARAKAISGEFEPEQTRWVVMAKGGSYAGWLKILWPKSDDLYAQARRILGSKYKDGAVYAPPGSILEVADFAERYGFAMSETPRRMLAEYRAALEGGAVVVDPVKGPAPLRVDSGVPRLSPEGAKIDDSLLDE